jgi:hypothetical protein
MVFGITNPNAEKANALRRRFQRIKGNDELRIQRGIQYLDAKISYDKN